MRKLLLCLLIVLASLGLYGAKRSSENLQIEIDDHGRLLHLRQRQNGTWRAIPFRKDQWGGPTFYIRGHDDKIALIKLTSDTQRQCYTGKRGELMFDLRYTLNAKGLTLTFGVENTGSEPFAPQTLGIRLGVDCYQAKYPDWQENPMPNVMRCEPTHHWGFAMSPAGKILAWVTDTPVASYSINYEPRQHRVYTANIDFINALPLPKRHPQHVTTIPPKTRLQWQLQLTGVSDESAILSTLSRLSDAPFFEPERHLLTPKEETTILIHGGLMKTLVVCDSEGNRRTLRPYTRTGTATCYRFSADTPGLYTFTATNAVGKQCEGSIFVRHPWRWYLEHAREEGLRVKPTETHHAECIYPFFSYFLARKHFPNAALDAECDKVFHHYFPLHYDASKKSLRTTYRIQDTAIWASILAARYGVTGDTKDLEYAANLVDYLVDTTQRNDGAYCSGHGTHYTCVIYIAKSIMEVMDAIRPLAARDTAWAARLAKYDASVKRAIDDLARRIDNIETEGQMTYEDGMISCAMMQLALYALTHPDTDTAPYIEAARRHAEGHRSLTLSLHPDARVNGATIRFWETQYTICMMSNMYNSPCGWTAWKLYADYYFYLLTGEERYLRELFNGMGACVQLMDHGTGRLRWGFTPDPYIKTRWAIPAVSPDSRHEHDWRHGVIGEAYLELISDWNRSKRIWRDKWGIDNFVHEVFKCMTECVMENAFIVEDTEGNYRGYNCTVKKSGDAIMINADEVTLRNFHFNLRTPTVFRIERGSKTVHSGVLGKGCRWIRTGGEKR